MLDVGANVGVAAAFFALECGARTVHCFEPVRPVFELLRRNLRDVPSCVLHEQGLSRMPGRARITYYPRAAAMSGLYADPARDRALVATALGNLGVPREEVDVRLEGAYQVRTLTCELTTLSSFLREEGLDHVDLLKVDVERAELDVLAGIDEADWPKISQTVIEVHDEDGRCTKLARELRERGFRVTLDQDPVMRGTQVRVLYAARR